MTDSPYFSVCIPTYNRAALLERCVGKLLNQTCGDYEILIGDNCSEDNTGEVAQRFNDERIIYHRQERNVGPWMNFISLLDMARGTYVLFHQDDDILHPHFLQRIRQVTCDHENITLAGTALWYGNDEVGFSSTLYCGLDGLTGERILNDEPLVIEGERLAVAYLYLNQFNPPAIAFERQTLLDAVDRTPLGETRAADVIAQVRCLCSGRAAMLPWPGGIYFGHAEQYSGVRSSSKRSMALKSMFTQLIREFDERGVSWQTYLLEELRRYGAKECWRHLRRWLKHSAPAPLVKVGRQAYRECQPRLLKRLGNYIFHLRPDQQLRLITRR